MALPPSDPTNEAFLREVDEEYRREQMLNIWRKYGRWIVAAVVAAIVALAAVLYLQHHGDRTAGRHGEDYDAALRLAEENQPDKALPAFDKAAAGGEGYAALSRIAQGNLLARKNDVKGAAAKFAEVVGDKAFAQPYRDLALVRQTQVEFDTLKPDAVIARLKDLAVPGSAWFGTAGEMVAAAKLKLGQRAEAAKLYSQIAQGGDNVPESIRQRAVQLAGVLAIPAAEQPKENKAQ